MESKLDARCYGSVTIKFHLFISIYFQGIPPVIDDQQGDLPPCCTLLKIQKHSHICNALLFESLVPELYVV